VLFSLSLALTFFTSFSSKGQMAAKKEAGAVVGWATECWPSVYFVLVQYGATEVFIFGSVLWKKAPGDLDLAVAGVPANLQLQIIGELEELTQKPIHLMLLETAPSGLVSFIYRFG